MKFNEQTDAINQREETNGSERALDLCRAKFGVHCDICEISHLHTQADDAAAASNGERFDAGARVIARATRASVIWAYLSFSISSSPETRKQSRANRAIEFFISGSGRRSVRR